jgi:3-oxoacyl-[acyl-carrier-protein] synthase-3
MIGIKDIAVYLPEQRVDNVEQARRFGEDVSFVDGKIGARWLPRRADGEDASDMAASAVRLLLERNPGLQAAGVGALVVVTQSGDGRGLPHTAAIVQRKLGLSATVAAFDVSLGCSGYVYGLYLMKGFLESSGIENGVLVTADPYSKIVDPADRTTTLLFGDAATATWIGRDAAWRLGAVAYGTDGSGADALVNRDGVLHMNGRAVFNFAAMKVAPHIRQVLDAAGLRPQDVGLYCLHQGSKAIVEAIARRFPEVADRFVEDIRDTGNTVSSSIPLLLAKGMLGSQHTRVLVSGFGVGFSWATALLHNDGNRSQ